MGRAYDTWLTNKTNTNQLYASAWAAIATRLARCALCMTCICTAIQLLQDTLDLQLHSSRSALRTTKTSSAPGPGYPFGTATSQLRRQLAAAAAAGAAAAAAAVRHHALLDELAWEPGNPIKSAPVAHGSAIMAPVTDIYNVQGPRRGNNLPNAGALQN